VAAGGSNRHNHSSHNGHNGHASLDNTLSALREHAEALAHSLRRSDSALDNIPLPLMEFDEKGRIFRANADCARVVNGAGTSLTGKSLFTFIAPFDHKRFREQLAVALRSSKPASVRLSLRRASGDHQVGMRIGHHVSDGRRTCVAVFETAEDLQERSTIPVPEQAASSLMHELLLNLGYAVDLSAVADVIANYCRKAFDSPVGMIFAERDRNLHILSQWRIGDIQKDCRPVEEVLKNGPVARAFRSGAIIVWRASNVQNSTASRYASRLLKQYRARTLAFLPIRAPKQPPVGVLAIALRKGYENATAIDRELMPLGHLVAGWMNCARAYEDAIAARSRAENAVHNKDEFLSILSHELKNPIMPILGWAVALSSGSLPQDKQNLALEGIVRNVRALNYLIEDLFDAARISSGKLSLQLSETRVQDVAREALNAVQPSAEKKKLRISTDISEAIPPFQADARRLHQVLMNLLNNAVKFTPAGGSISLQIRRRADQVECTVSDTGKGMDPQFIPYVFDRFRQENRGSKLHATGLGLGLTIVHEIVQLHGGVIEAASPGIDKGATFTVRLPIRKQHSHGAPRRTRRVNAGEGPKKQA